MTTENQIHRFPWGIGDNPQTWIVHFGSKSTPLIAQLCRETGRCSRVLKIEDLEAEVHAGVALPKLVILSGGDQSVFDAKSLTLADDVYRTVRSNCHLLGICYGAQLLAKLEGGEVRRAERAEYGSLPLTLTVPFGGYRGGNVIMNHRDEIVRLPDGWKTIASTDRCRHAFAGKPGIWAVQFHPEMSHTTDGHQLLEEVLQSAGTERDYVFDPESFVKKGVQWLGTFQGKFICGLSGGVDSAIAFRLAEQAFGDRVHGIFVDTGWMREGELEEVRAVFGTRNVTYVNASARFHAAIEAIQYPEGGDLLKREYVYYEAVRKTMGRVFIEVFLDIARGLGGADGLVQGTNYSDIIESMTGLKSHHNVALPELLKVFVCEPLAGIYKNEIRQLALFLDLPLEVVYRQPFPGPGNTLRGWGRLDRSMAKVRRDGNRILEEVVRKHYPHHQARPCQYYVAPMPLPSTGLMGDDRVIGYAWGVRLVDGGARENYASLDPFHPSRAFHDELTHRLTTETACDDGTRFVRVFFETTGRPPSTTEPH